MGRRREENQDVERSRSRDRRSRKKAKTSEVDVEPPPAKHRKHRSLAADDGVEAPADLKQKKRSSRPSQEVGEHDPDLAALDIELHEAGEKLAARKHRKSAPARDVSIDSEDLRGAGEPPSKKAGEEVPSTAGINIYRELYRKASKTLSKGSEAVAEPDPDNGDVDFEELEALMDAKNKVQEIKEDPFNAAPVQSPSSLQEPLVGEAFSLHQQTSPFLRNFAEGLNVRSSSR